MSGPGLVALVAGLVVAAVACAGRAGDTPEGRAWRAESLEAGDGLVEPIPTATPTLRLDGERASGSAGCNRYSASYALDGSKLSFGPIAATKMFCAADGVMEQEDRFLRLLASVDTWRLEGERLVLEAERTPILVFAETG